MRQIKASEVKPGMVVRWESRGFTHEGTVERVTSGTSLYTTRFINGYFGINTPSDATVTVLSEPQPEEPTEFGARVMAGGLMFVRVTHHERPWVVSLDGELYDWNDLCKLGPVTVIEAEPYWEIPTDVDSDSEVPERIEEWPEDDTTLREHKWRDRDGDLWTWRTTASEWDCHILTDGYLFSRCRPSHGPWTRVTDA